MTDQTLLPLLRGRQISLDDALESDKNLLDQLKWPAEMLDFCYYLYTNLAEIRDVVARHLRVPASDLEIGEFADWRHGSFNTCIPIEITKRHPRLPARVFIRFPQPFKVGEAFHPGNVDEKLRCEAATYVWLGRNCPGIPIPRLLGLGFPGTQSFTAVENESLWNRLVWHLRRLWAGQALSPYFGHHRHALFEIGYLVIEHVEQGDMLSETWEQHRSDTKRRANLFRGLSQILLSLAKIPHPRIGSWTMDDRGFLSLTNRPLALMLHEFESHNIPTNIARDLTYCSVEPWVLDTLACQDNRIRYQPNAIHDHADGRSQLSALTGLRALLPNLVSRQDRGGPFVLSLTDLHASNIFVDDDWHIKCIIDLEFACVLPTQMVTVPHWLTSRGIDQLTDNDLEEYEAMYEEFVDAVKHEEEEAGGGGGQLADQDGETKSYSQILRQAWATGGFWYSQALTSLDAFTDIFYTHLLPRFGGDLHSEAEEALMKLWSKDAASFIEDKIVQQKGYDEQIRELFAKAGKGDQGGNQEENQEGHQDLVGDGEGH